jgi:hypothetical protein
MYWASIQNRVLHGTIFFWAVHFRFGMIDAGLPAKLIGLLVGKLITIYRRYFPVMENDT